MFGLQLIVKRLGIVIVDENERSPWRQRVDKLENLGVSLCRYKGSHIDFLGC
jgi:hypothetical protein